MNITPSSALAARPVAAVSRPPSPQHASSSTPPQTVSSRPSVGLPAQETAVGMSPVMQAFLMRLQELESYNVGTDGSDAPLERSKRPVDAGTRGNVIDDVTRGDPNSITLFDAGDGGNPISAGRDAAINLAQDMSVDNMTVSVFGTTAIISFGGADRLVVDLAFGSVTLNFSDGKTVVVMAETLARSFEADQAEESRSATALAV